MNSKLKIILRIFLPFGLGYFLSYTYRMVNGVLAPNLACDLGLAPGSLGLLTSTYFLAFAAFQLPLGILLDRFGSRRVEPVLLLVAAGGAFIFAHAHTLATLVLGRALIGVGVSAGLMAALKAFRQWFPAEQLPQVNSVQMICGGLGGLFATAPVEAALKVTDWRGVFSWLGAVTVASAALIFFLVPESDEVPAGEPLSEQLKEIATIYTSRQFWRIAPLAITAQATFMSMPGLWAGPWLRDLAGFGRNQVAATLLGLSAFMMAGHFFYGAITGALSRRGIAPMTTAGGGLALFIVVQALLVWGDPFPAAPLWVLFGFAGTATALPYAIISQTFPKRLAGRANTALNMPNFLAAFAVQWGVGAIVGLWPVSASGGYHPAGYRCALGLLVLLQALTAAWFWLSGRVKLTESEGAHSSAIAVADPE